MRQFVVGLFFAFMLAGALPAFAQTSPARVCVAEVETREPSISAAAVRELRSSSFSQSRKVSRRKRFHWTRRIPPQ
jgi:hypothetical protein